MRGFTLIELMVTIAIAAILLTIGVPSFRTLIDSQRLTTAVNDLYSSIKLTAGQAKDRRARVDLMPIDGDDWNKGWVVFVDNNENGKADFSGSAPNDEIIYSIGPVTDGITIKTKFTDEAKQYVAYNASGRTRTDANGHQPQMGTFSFWQNGEVKKRIKLDFMGQPRICDPNSTNATEKASCTDAADSN